MFKESFSDRLAQLRIAKKVSARQMSLDLGQSEGYINSIENKNSLPSMEIFHHICDYLEVRPKDFFDYENINPPVVNQMMTDIKKLDAKQLEIVSLIVQEFLKSRAAGRK